jgi:hypothetical protein
MLVVSKSLDGCEAAEVLGTDTGWSSGCDAVSLSESSGLGRLDVMILRGGAEIRAAVRCGTFPHSPKPNSACLMHEVFMSEARRSWGARQRVRGDGEAVGM